MRQRSRNIIPVSAGPRRVVFSRTAVTVSWLSTTRPFPWLCCFEVVSGWFATSQPLGDALRDQFVPTGSRPSVQRPASLTECKTPTTADVTVGITPALRHVLERSNTAIADVAGVMIGTTPLTTTIAERPRLQPTATVRVRLLATAALTPIVDWLPDLAEALDG